MTDVKLHRVIPNTQGHNLVVKVMSKRVLVDKMTAAGTRHFHAHYTVADDTGSMLLDVHEDVQLPINSVVALHNVATKVINYKIRLSLGKWSSVETTTRTIRGQIRTDPNFSEVLYKLSEPSK